jgi:hypothetical protein
MVKVKMSNLAKRLQKETPQMVPEEVVLESEVIQIDPDLIPDTVKNPQKVYEDPRPDLEEDSNLWLQLFIEAEKTSAQLKENLYKMRNWGTRIVRGKTQFILRPDIDEDGIRAWPDQETYEKWRDRLLVPHKKQIAEMLKRLFIWEGSKK